MKKKLFTSFVAFFALAITACNVGPKVSEESKEEIQSEEVQQPSSQAKPSSSKHQHTYDESTWSYNETKHWHPATCEHTDAKGSSADHTFEDVPAESTTGTCDAPGKLVQKCSVCGYKREITVQAAHDFQAVTPTHEQGEGEVAETIEKCSRDNTLRITWDAQDAAKSASSGFDSNGKFKAKQDYAEYKFYSPKALSARLYVKIANRSGSSDSPYDRATKSGNQSIWFDYYNGPDWKYGVKVNDNDIDQDNQEDIVVNGEAVAMKELMYQDFLEEGASELVAPWFTFSVNEGQNTLRIERTQGYSVSVKEFYVIGA